MSSANQQTRVKTAPNKREFKAAQQLEELRNVADTMIDRGQGRKAVGVLLDVIADLKMDNERLTFRLMAATRARFGRSSEKLSAQELKQLVLALGGTEEEASTAVS